MLLDDNALDDRGALALAKALRSRALPCLTDLLVAQTGIGAAGRRALDEAVESTGGASKICISEADPAVVSGRLPGLDTQWVCETERPPFGMLFDALRTGAAQRRETAAAATLSKRCARSTTA